MGDLAPGPLFVCVQVPEFPTQARLRLRAEQARVPVAILDGSPPFEFVCSANRRALLLGIAQGTTKTELNSFAGVTTLRRSAQEESATRAALLDVAAMFTPRTEVYNVGQTSSPAFRFVLDMSGTGRIFGEPPHMAERITHALRKLRLSSKLAVSSNFHTAVCASGFAGRTPWIISPGRERDALNGLPIVALRLTEQERSTFELWGLRTVGELAQLPEMDVAVRLGESGRRLRELARGEHPHLMVPEEPTYALEEQMQFDAPLENLESLLFVLGPMIGQLIVRAQAHALALSSLTLRFSLDGAGEYVRSIRPALASEQKDVLLKLVHLDLQSNPPSAGVLQVRIQAEPGKRSKVQTGLFSPPLPEPLRLDVTLARLRALVGEGRVGRARLLDTHRSDAFTMEGFTVPAKAPREESVGATVALRRFRPPVSLRVVQLNAHAPCSFFYGDTRYTVAEAYGPWRRSGEWWSEHVWSQEEWDVRATSSSGTRLLGILSHDLLHKRWQLEALYD